MVTPVTTKCIPELKRAKTKVWLPEGTWFDFFNGMIYEGGRSMDLYRTLEEIPVLAKAGAIIPMTEKISALDVESNPDELTVRVYAVQIIHLFCTRMTILPWRMRRMTVQKRR